MAIVLLPAAFRYTVVAFAAVSILTNETVIVPSKSLVGVITRPAVVFVVGPQASVADTPAKENPPKASVIEPVVRPVIVQDSL
jgi:hypothetical protein